MVIKLVMNSNCRIDIVSTAPACVATWFLTGPDLVTVIVLLARFLSLKAISFEIYKFLPLFSMCVTESFGSGDVSGE